MNKLDFYRKNYYSTERNVTDATRRYESSPSSEK